MLALATAIALLVGAGGLALMTRWSVHAVPAAEARQIIEQRRDATYLVTELADGTRQLAITLPGTAGVTRLQAPADAALVALLEQHRRNYRRIVQGPDFTFADPSPLASGVVIAVLAGTAVVLLWWAQRRSRPSVERT